MQQWAKHVRLTPECWLWTGPVVTDGWGSSYGRFSVANKKALAHRFAYERFVGEIPEGLVMDHVCNNTLCVNPEHLRPVSQRENVLRGEHSKVACPRGHPYTTENTYVWYNKRGWMHRYCKTCKAA